MKKSIIILFLILILVFMITVQVKIKNSERRYEALKSDPNVVAINTYLTHYMGHMGIPIQECKFNEQKVFYHKMSVGSPITTGVILDRDVIFDESGQKLAVCKNNQALEGSTALCNGLNNCKIVFDPLHDVDVYKVSDKTTDLHGDRSINLFGITFKYQWAESRGDYSLPYKGLKTEWFTIFKVRKTEGM